MKLSRAQLFIALVCVILGFMLAYQFKNAKNITTIANTRQIENLQKQLEDAQKQKEELEKNIAELDKKIQGYEENAAQGSSIAESLKKELDNARMFAGLTKVEGPGVTVTLSPQKSNIENNVNVPVDAYSLQMVINELNACGAEAIMINNQRLVSSTQIRDVGSDMYFNVSINGIKFSSLDNFDIKAIGDPDALESGLKLVDGVQQTLVDSGLGVDIKKSDKVTILKSQKVSEFNFARPAKEGE
ncbi:MAG TPA: hypothetical protein DD429_02285 [Clostridiaceae bacterium]|nr:hypothetical protein [Clostridiaceae bacterium]